MFPTDFKKDNIKTVNAFLRDFFDNYNSMIEKDNNINLSLPYKTIEAIITYIPDEKQKIILSKISQTLKEIYIKYFEFELGKNKTLAKKSLNNLIDFARDFEIYPYIINQTQLVTYYNIMTKNDSVGIVSKANCGELFTFDKFCLMIVHFSILSYFLLSPKSSHYSKDFQEIQLYKCYLTISSVLYANSPIFSKIFTIKMST